jgi:CTP-dependent riboflavin kinase
MHRLARGESRRRLSGVVTRGIGVAAARNRGLWSVFLAYVPALDEYVYGTLNVVLDDPFETPPTNLPGVFRVPVDVVPLRPGFPKEGFTFVKVESILGEPVDALIYRPDCTCHPSTVVELMSRDVLRERFRLTDGDRIDMTVDCGH